MEAVILILSAWIAILYLEASYWIVRAVLRWAPMNAAGVGAGWLAKQSGFEILEALGVGVAVCLVARRALRPRY